MNYDFDADGTGIEGEDDTDQEAAWLTDALHGRVQSGGVLDYSFYRSEETEGWLLLRRVASREIPEVVAEYPIDHDIYQMFQSAVAAVKRVVAGGGDRKGFNDDHSVYRHGL